MSRYTGPKSRLCRREGVCLCGREKCAIKKKGYKPGMHGQKNSLSKPSEYARQLREKQKLKKQPLKKRSPETLYLKCWKLV